MAAESGDTVRCLQILGLGEGASEDEIRKSYKKLALIHHPDKNTTDPQATEKFQELSEAYTYLMRREEIEEDDGYSPYEDDLDLLDLLRLFAHLNGHHCGAWAPQTGLFHGRTVYFYDDEDDDDFYPNEPVYYQDPYSGGSKTKKYSDRYQSSCEQTSHQSTSQKTVGEGDNGRCVNRERQKAEKLRQRQERHEQEAKQRKAKMKSESEDGSGEPTTVHDTRGQHSGQAKKPSKKQLLAEQRRREKEMTAIAEELQQQCHLAAEKERKRQEKEEEKRSLLTQSLRTDADLEDDPKLPAAETKTESKQSLGPTKARRKREGKQKRRLARIQNKGKTAEIKETGTQPSQPNYTAGVTSAMRNEAVSDEEWTEECDQFLDHYTGISPVVSPGKATASTFYQCPAHTLKDTTASSRHALHTPACHPKNTSTSNRVIDSVRHNNRFRSTSNAQYSYNDRFASGFCATRPGSRVHDDVVNETTVNGEFDEVSNGHSKDWPEDCARVDPGITYPVYNNLPVDSGARAGDLCTFNDFPSANGFGDSGTVNNNVVPQQTGYNPVAPPAWSEPVAPPVKNVWQERQQFVSEVLPQSVDEEEEMLRVAIEMSRLQMQEDTLRREMWQQEYALQQFH